jgi:hypothetical protein
LIESRFLPSRTSDAGDAAGRLWDVVGLAGGSGPGSAVWLNRIPIRLTDERCIHIGEEHSELAGYLFDVIEAVETPKAVVEEPSRWLFGR